MQKEELFQYYDELLRFALQKCGSQEDAEDLASETMLAAFTSLHEGKSIDYPKTWLANTLMHKYNSMLRKRYRMPLVVNLEDISESVGEEGVAYIDTDEAAEVRRELLYLAEQMRNVLIRFYYRNQSVAEIAAALQIPEGTVKSRLSAGRIKMKKGLETMNTGHNRLPGLLRVSSAGIEGPRHEPTSLVQNDLIAQNILAVAYEKPMELTEIAAALGIPTVYIEPIAERLVNGELMVQTKGGGYYTDFIIYRPEDELKTFEAQKRFVHAHFDVFWRVMKEALEAVWAMPYTETLNPRQKKKLERYVLFDLLQNFEIKGSGKSFAPSPKRKDGGAWTAQGYYTPAGYDQNKSRNVWEYKIWGGRRTSGYQNILDAKRLVYHEFDVPMWDNPQRFAISGRDDYFNGIIMFLWCVYTGRVPENSGISSTLIENIEGFKEAGLFAERDGELVVDIPVMEASVFADCNAIINRAWKTLVAELGDAYVDFLRGNMVILPPHLKSVPEFLKYAPSTRCIVMAVIREAYEKGLHLHDVDYCCPPVVLVYEEEN